MFTNDAGAVFGSYEVLAFERPDYNGPCVYLDKESYWFPVHPGRLERIGKAVLKSRFSSESLMSTINRESGEIPISDYTFDIFLNLDISPDTMPIGIYLFIHGCCNQREFVSQ